MVKGCFASFGENGVQIGYLISRRHETDNLQRNDMIIELVLLTGN